MAEKWVKVQDHTYIIDAEVDEVIEILENISFSQCLDWWRIWAWIKNSDHPKSPIPSFINTESSVDVLRNYCEGIKSPTKTKFSQ